jgi:peptidoglycan/xylan/chitin deacetylase (PgdA/CDA1 family)
VFLCSQPVLAFDQFRVPYRIQPADGDAPPPGPGGYVTARVPGGRCMRWPAFETCAAARSVAAPPRRFQLGPLVLHGRLLPDDVVRAWTATTGDGWRAAEALTDGTGAVGSTWRSDTGDILLPFDPNEIVTTFWSERYASRSDAPSAGLRARAVAAYYLVRPLLPRRVQIAARRLYSRVQARTTFPRWPVETSLHGFLDRFLRWAAETAGEDVPHVAPWPGGRTWALVLTHDVETADGLRRLPAVRDTEKAAGYRSSWNFVPGRYAVPDPLVAQLQADGFEVGLHGLHHDGRDLADGVREQRLPEMRRWARRWNATGFRSPATQRAWSTMAALPFEYDSSYPDTDPFEPQPGGCCSWLPYFNGPVVELPITLPQDHTVFVILRRAGAGVWIDKSETIRAAGGMALLITHPDYFRAAPVGPAYEELLAHFAADASAWRALPGEVNRWWRRRAESHLERVDGRWRIIGPAREEGRVVVTPFVGRS